MSLFAARLIMACSALYDGVLGVAFLFAAPRVFKALDIPPVNHDGYVHFPAWLLIVFALMFAAVAARPQANANLIPYGVLLKLGYITVASWHWLQTGIPFAWKPFVIIDAVFVVLFILAYRSIRARRG